MIPISLKFKGLYSYREEQAIDFRKLTSSQLFGIFGPIGCGKSSILEAIMFSLYDQSDRLNNRDNRYYNMLNLQSNELEIDFEFRSDTSGEEKYRVYFRASRNKKHYGQVNLRSRDFYIYENGEWLPLEDKDASRILGMTYQNFMQTVIIPQGKFRDFVDQNPTKRTQMLKELFHLEKFELSHKAGSLHKKTQLAIRGTEERLAEIGAVSEDEVVQGRQEIEEWEKALAANVKQQQEAEQACQQQDELRKLFENIQHTQKQLAHEEEQRTLFEKREQRLKDYNRAVTYFNEKLQSLVESSKEITQLRQGRDKKQKEIKQQEAEQEKARVHLAEKQKVFEQQEQKEQQCLDLEHVIEIRKYKDTLQQQQKRLSEARQRAEQIREKKETLLWQINAGEEKLNHFESKLKHQPELQQLEHWHETHHNLLQEEKEGKEQEKEYLLKLDTLKQEKARLLEPYDWARQNGSFEKCRALLKEQIENFRSRQDKINEQLRELQISEKIASYAASLRDGSACPLCGSVHHPEIAHQESVTQQLKEQQADLKHCKAEEKTLLQMAEKIGALEMDFNSCQQLQKQLASRQQQCSEKIEKHQQQFRWEAFEKYQPDEIHDFLKKLNALGEEADQLRQKLQKDRKQHQKLEEALQEAQNTQNKAQQEETTLTTCISNHLQLIRLISYDKLDHYDLPALSQSLEKGRHQLKVAVEEYEKALQQVHTRENTLIASRSRLEAEVERLEAYEKKAARLEKEIEQLCEEKNFSDLDQVQSLLSLDLDTEEEQEAINLYKTGLASLQSQLEKMQKEASGKSYREHEHQQLQQTLMSLKEEVQKCQENCALSRQHVKSLLEKLRSSQELQKKLEALNRREENLKEIKKLFNGSGFVKYVSSVYLDNLCRTANERFMKLTRNNLSLELNEENEFIVRDYLNNGKTRLLKTLSGGQTFQAALCLALALAENVKTLNQAEQSFFFLDEGFGSLDRASLRVVFDTLKSLRHEKRIVGIISHVEELQQEIDVYLQVENDKERGSLISSSWE